MANIDIGTAPIGTYPTNPVPTTPLKVVWVTAERLAMLATARRNKISDSCWAAISGFAASLPATAHDLVDAYTGSAPGLQMGRLIDVAVTLGFLGFLIAALLMERGKSAQELLTEIMNPETQPRTPA